MTSLIDETLIPIFAIALTDGSRPAPGPLTNTSTVFTPASTACLTASSVATCAAKGVPLRLPLKPSLPALDQQTVFPPGSVIEMIVLANPAWI